jgi:hypothetical protein
MSVLEVVRFRIFKGTNFNEPFQLLNQNRVPIDLTDCEVIARIKKFPTSTAFESFTIVYSNRPEGRIRLTMNGLTTANLLEGRNYFDIFVVYPDETVKLEVKGTSLVHETSYTFAEEI